MSKQTAHAKKLKELIGDIHFAMLTTAESDGTLRSRPMTLLEQTADDELRFLTALDTPKVEEITNRQMVNVSFAAPKSNRYVSVSGHAWVTQEKEIINRLWSPMYKAWFPKGEEDPRLAILHVAVDSAEYWEASASRMVQVAGYFKALVSGNTAKPGAHAKIRVERQPYPDEGEYEAPTHSKSEHGDEPGPAIIEPITESPD